MAHGHLGDTATAREALDRVMLRVAALTAADERIAHLRVPNTAEGSPMVCAWSACRKSKCPEGDIGRTLRLVAGPPRVGISLALPTIGLGN